MRGIPLLEGGDGPAQLVCIRKGRQGRRRWPAQAQNGDRDGSDEEAEPQAGEEGGARPARPGSRVRTSRGQRPGGPCDGHLATASWVADRQRDSPPRERPVEDLAELSWRGVRVLLARSQVSSWKKSERARVQEKES